MVTRSYQRGHKIVYLKDKWVYADNLESADKERPCVKCGKNPTKEGYDACIGKLDGVKSACCGHGIERGFQLNRE